MDTISPAARPLPARLSRLTRRFALLALVFAGLGLLLARYDVIGKLAGFGLFVGGGFVALLAVLLGVMALIKNRGTDPQRSRTIAAVLISAVFAGFIISRPLMSGDVPPIHDVTTDLANPPQFKTLPLRADNLAGVETVENWRKIHQAAYGRLTGAQIAKPPAEVFAAALKLAEAQGWTIAAKDEATGHIEATASVSFIRFKDDVVIRVTPLADGAQSRVDVRSVSRVGVSDFGVNAKRIDAYLKGLTTG